MLPAQQRFEPTDLSAADRHLRLIDQIEITILDGLAHAVFKHQTRTRAAVHFMIIETILLTPGTLGFVHGNVRSAQQTVEIAPTVGISSDADTGAKDDIQAFDLLTDRYPFDEFFGNLRRLLGKLQIQQRGEFIAAHARENIERPQARLQLLGNPAQHAVAGVMAEGIIDPFEAIEIEVEQHPAAVAAFPAQQQVFHGLVEPAPVEQPGQRIGYRLEFQLLVQVTHHRHVQHRHHHRVLLRGQRRAGQCHRHLLPGRRAQQRIMQAQGFTALVTGVELGIGPQGNVWLLQEIEKLLAFQILHRRIEQSRNRRVGKADHAVLAQHQNAFGGVVQHRGIEGARHFQVMTEALQGTAIALVLEQRLDLGLEDLRIERLEQVIHRAAGISLDHSILRLLVGGEENDRCQPRALAAAHQPCDFETVHAGHLHIEQDQVDVVFEQKVQRLETRGGGHHVPILTLQQRAHADQIFGVIIDDQKDRAAFTWLGLRAFHAASLIGTGCRQNHRRN